MGSGVNGTALSTTIDPERSGKAGAETQSFSFYSLRLYTASFLNVLCIWLRTFLILASLGPGSAALRENLLPGIHLPLGTLSPGDHPLRDC